MTEQNQEMQELQTNENQPVEVSEHVVLPPTQSKAKRFFLRILRWFFGLAIVFGLGFLTALILLYVPARQSINNYKSAIEGANQRIESLTSEAGKSQEFAQKYQNSQTELMNNEISQAILRTQIDVTSAMLALANNDLEKAKTYLSTSKEKLLSLGSLVKSDKIKTITDMQARLELVINEIGTDPYAATSDLDVLSTNLQQLEETYISTP